MKSHFTFADCRRIEKVLNVMRNLAEKDNFFAVAVEEFDSAVGTEKYNMAEHLLKIYNDAKESGIISTGQAVVLSSYW